jgi:hypothetical protein
MVKELRGRRRLWCERSPPASHLEAGHPLTLRLPRCTASYSPSAGLAAQELQDGRRPAPHCGRVSPVPAKQMLEARKRWRG